MFWFNFVIPKFKFYLIPFRTEQLNVFNIESLKIFINSKQQREISILCIVHFFFIVFNFYCLSVDLLFSVKESYLNLFTTNNISHTIVKFYCNLPQKKS